jgi:hypothetical protein
MLNICLDHIPMKAETNTLEFYSLSLMFILHVFLDILVQNN